MLSKNLSELEFTICADTQFLTGQLTRDTVIQLNNKVVARLLATNPLILDLSALRQVDTAGLAWLLYLVEQASKHQVTISFSHLPEDLLKLMQLTGVDLLLPRT